MLAEGTKRPYISNHRALMPQHGVTDMTKNTRAKTITLTNDFHRTAINVRPLITGYLSPRQVARVDRKLCGVKGCTCAGQSWGGYKIEFEHDGSAIVIAPLY